MTVSGLTISRQLRHRDQTRERTTHKTRSDARSLPFLIASFQDHDLMAERQDFQLQGGARPECGCKGIEYWNYHVPGFGE
jgi:hypothetical protein